MKVKKIIRFIAFVALFFFPNYCLAQKITKADLLSMIKERWKSKVNFGGMITSFDSSLLAESNTYKINGKYYDSSLVIKALNTITKKDILTLSLSWKIDRTVDRKIYEFLISIRTNKYQTKSDKKYNYERIISEYIIDKYSDKDNERLGNARDFALIIDDEVIPPHKARAQLFSIEFKDIECIDICGIGYEYPIYGENSKNGQVFIWTKRRKG